MVCRRLQKRTDSVILKSLTLQFDIANTHKTRQGNNTNNQSWQVKELLARKKQIKGLLF